MKQRFLCLLLALVLLLSIPALATPPSGSEKLDLLKELDWYITHYYVDSDGTSRMPSVTAAQLDADPALFDKLAGEMVSRLDKYSHFYSRELYDQHYPMGNDFIGFGISADLSLPKGYVVADVLEDSSAEAAGLRVGDMIVSIDGKDLTGIFAGDAYALFTGKEGTFGVFKIVRPGEKDFLTVSVERKPFYVPHVEAGPLIADASIGYIGISQFGTDEDYDDFSYYWDELRRQGVKKVIIDLRGNPGGSINVLYDMLNLMIGRKDMTLFTLVESLGDTEVYKTEGTGGAWQPDKLVVLVDEHSASAAEMFSGTLKDNGLATVVGVQTFGKSRGQYHIELSSGDMLVLTGSKVQLPKTGDYEGKGIAPHAVVEWNPVPYKAADGIVELSAGAALFPAYCRGDRKLAVEQRLSLLGYFRGVPDNTWDWYTQQCLIAFEKGYDLPVTQTYAGAPALRKLGELYDQLLKSEVYGEDPQMKRAIEIVNGK